MNTTTNIVRALRNSTTPAACLATWQNNGTRKNLATLRKHAAPGYPCRPYKFPENPSASDWRKALVNDPAFRHGTPEMSSPESEASFLWVSGGDSPEVLNTWAGRKFLDHRGWYTMDEFSNTTIETYAVRLKRFPKLMFYATMDSDNGDLCVHLSEWEEIDFSDCADHYDAEAAVEDAARSVIRRNDATTECNAEERRDYFEKDQREQRIEENREELKGIRESARRLISELRELCPTLGDKYPAAREAVQGALRGLLRERRALIAKNVELANA